MNVLYDDYENADWLIDLQRLRSARDGIPADADLPGTPRPVEAKEANPITAILRRRPA